VIRRGFWLATGAVLGVAGYRKAARLARAITVPPALTTPGRAGRRVRPIGGRAAGQRAIESRPDEPPLAQARAAPARAGHAPAPGRPGVPVTDRIRAAVRFARDVRDGMAEYRDLHARPLGRRLGNRNSGPPGDRAPASRGGIQP
jgi:hypothetical protein